MAVKLRMTRMGRRHRPFFRINAVESRTPRDGRILEKIGHYDPMAKNVEEQIVLNTERAQYWLSVGAVPSDTVADILRKNGLTCKYMEAKKARRDKAKELAKKAGKPFTKADRIALEKAAEAAAAAKAAAEEAAKAEAEAKAKAAEEAAAAQESAE